MTKHTLRYIPNIVTRAPNWIPHMKHKSPTQSLSVFDQISQGLNESIAQLRGDITLRSTTLPAPAPKLTKTRVSGIRTKAGMSQAIFARILNVPTKTLQSWEQGARQPKASEARLLQLFDISPNDIIGILNRAETPAPSKHASKKSRPAKPKQSTSSAARPCKAISA